jgi:hypothetical protein
MTFSSDLVAVADQQAVWENIIDLVIRSLVCADDVIPYQPNSFEVFGYDVLIDDTLRPWLIEVNSSPSMGTDSELDSRVKHQMIMDTIKLVRLCGAFVVLVSYSFKLERLFRRQPGGSAPVQQRKALRVHHEAPTDRSRSKTESGDGYWCGCCWIGWFHSCTDCLG